MIRGASSRLLLCSERSCFTSSSRVLSSLHTRHAVVAPLRRTVVNPLVHRTFAHATAPARRAELPSAPSKEEQDHDAVDAQEPRLSLTFTCAVPDCGHRSTHTFTKRSYERGIVLVQCPGCKNRHLIADHLSWFTQSDDEPKTIEQMIEAKGGRIRKGVQYVDGKEYETVEIESDEQYPGKGG